MSVGVKYDGEKPRWSLLPTELLWGAVQVLEHGARKYSPNNWMHVPNGVERYSDAAARHLAAIERGEANDPDSGLPHVYHYLCSAIFVAWKVLNRPDELKAWQERGAVVVPVSAPEPFDALRERADAYRKSLIAKYCAPEPMPPPGAVIVVKAPPLDHEHIFELYDSGNSLIRSWHCACGDAVSHENGTNVYKRHFKAGGVDSFNTYFAATRAR